MKKRLSNFQLLVIALVFTVGITVVKMYDQSATDWHFINQHTHLESMNYANDALDSSYVIIDSDIQQWVELDYILPAFSSFTTTLEQDGWYINGEKTDSARTLKFFKELTYVEASGIFTGVPESSLVSPDYMLSIIDINGDTTIVKCFVRASNLVVTSNQSPGIIFNGRVDSLFEQVYVGKARFFAKNPN